MFLFIVLLIFFSSEFTPNLTSANPLPYPSRALTLEELQYYANTTEGKAALQFEFGQFKSGNRKPCTEAVKSANRGKNRFEFILPYDDNRVVLEALPNDPHSDYINANYIDGQNSEKEYIATQAPLPNTIKDFWRMIWQENSTEIVMMANIIEGGRQNAHKYWPDTTEIHGNITVTKLSEYSIPKLNHVVRTFSVQKIGDGNPRIVRQFHYTGWSDFSVPKSGLAALAIVYQAKKFRPDNHVPLVIHCSGGAGRTGTIILADSMIERGKVESVVNFPKRLEHMRQQRPQVVELKEQYVFAHQLVNEFFRNETEEYLQNIDEEYKKVEDAFYNDTLNALLLQMKSYNNVMRGFTRSILDPCRELNETIA